MGKVMELHAQKKIRGGELGGLKRLVKKLLQFHLRLLSIDNPTTGPKILGSCPSSSFLCKSFEDLMFSFSIFREEKICISLFKRFEFLSSNVRKADLY